MTPLGRVPVEARIHPAAKSLTAPVERSTPGRAEDTQASFEVAERGQKIRIFVRQPAEPEVGAQQGP